MLNTGLTLQLKRQENSLSDASLLIVTDNFACLEEIEQVLNLMSFSPQYKNVTCEHPSKAIANNNYDLIIYNSIQENFSSSPSAASITDYLPHPVPALVWWYNSEQRIPLILITEPLGDEMAIACMQSGINNYLLRRNLSQLPYLIKQTLTESAETVNQASPQNGKAPPAQPYQNNQLFKQIEQLEQELCKLQDENIDLQTAQNNSNQEYFSHLNHELRSPLANILQFAKMLRDQIYGSLNPKQAEYIAGIITSGNHLSDLINDYLDLAKIDANHEELFPEKLAVEDICDASLVMVKGRAKDKELKLRLDIADDIDFCYADSLRLKQILINLLSNAIKFTEQGSVLLKVAIVGKTINFSVIDTGIGIAPEDAEKLFQPFQQVNNHLQGRYKGTGLGLVLSLKLAKLHGGDITLTSELDQGSCFTVSLPHSNLVESKVSESKISESTVSESTVSESNLAHANLADSNLVN